MDPLTHMLYAREDLAQSATQASTKTFTTALWFNAAIFGIELAEGKLVGEWLRGGWRWRNFIDERWAGRLRFWRECHVKPKRKNMKVAGCGLLTVIAVWLCRRGDVGPEREVDQGEIFVRNDS